MFFQIPPFGVFLFLKIMASQTFWIGQKSSKQNSEKLGFISKLISWRDLREGLTGFLCPAQPTHASRWKFCEMFFGFVWWPQTGQKWIVYPCFTLCSGFAQVWGCQRQQICVKRKQKYRYLQTGPPLLSKFMHKAWRNQPEMWWRLNSHISIYCSSFYFTYSWPFLSTNQLNASAPV